MDDVFTVKGLGGEKKLSGEVKISGSKNAVLPLLASTFLFEDEVAFSNVPEIEDVDRTKELLEALGAKVQSSKGKIRIDTSAIKEARLDAEIAKRMRASVICTGPLLARFGRVDFPHPGGCVIGKRPIDFFLEGYMAMGAEVEENSKSYVVTANKLTGADIFLRVPSVTVTEALMMTAVLAKGETIIRNAAMEPEVATLGEFLVSCGAKILGVGTSELRVTGTGMLNARGKTWMVIPDRLEAGSYLVLGALCARNLTIKKCEPEHLHALITLLSQSGVPIKVGKSSIAIEENSKANKTFKSFDIKTHEYPGFPTDLQAPTVVFLTQASGEGRVFETIFENRLQYVNDLMRMHADIELLDQHRVVVRGPKQLKAKQLKSPDIRAGLGFVVAAAVAEGESVIHDVYYIDRGYERIEEKLQGIGLEISRVKE